MAKFITQILQELNEDHTKVSLYRDNAALKLMFEYAFNPDKKFLLPSGEPPWKRDPAPQGTNPTNFYQEVKRFYVFLRQDLKPIRREQIFIQLLEGLHPSESEVLLAIKEQTLHVKYPKLTHEFAYLNGFVTVEPPKRNSKSGGGLKESTKVKDTISIEVQRPLDTEKLKNKGGRPKGSKNKPKENSQ